MQTDLDQLKAQQQAEAQADAEANAIADEAEASPIATGEPAPPLPQPQARVTSISMSRLYNKGNYENCKIDICAEVPEGVSAVCVLLSLHRILSALKPQKGDTYELREAKELLDKPEHELTESDKLRLDAARELINDDLVRRQARERAIRQLDSLGGTVTGKDAKESWDNDDDESLF